jgi:hypothetical protein
MVGPPPVGYAAASWTAAGDTLNPAGAVRITIAEPWREYGIKHPHKPVEDPRIASLMFGIARDAGATVASIDVVFDLRPTK